MSGLLGAAVRGLMGHVGPDDTGREFCYLTTFGRRTGRSHTIEIWFAAADAALYLISGGGERSDWVRNLAARAEASVRLGDRELAADARLPLPLPASPERDAAVTGLHEKYAPQVSASAEDWRRSAFVVALDLRP